MRTNHIFINDVGSSWRFPERYRLISTFRTEFNCDSIPNLSLVDPIFTSSTIQTKQMWSLVDYSKIYTSRSLLFLGITTVVGFVQRHTRYIPCLPAPITVSEWPKTVKAKTRHSCVKPEVAEVQTSNIRDQARTNSTLIHHEKFKNRWTLAFLIHSGLFETKQKRPNAIKVCCWQRCA